MNKKILKAALAGTAVVALAAGGGTWASWSDFGEVNGNDVGAGFLKLNLNGQDGSSAVAPLSWGRLAPGMSNVRTVWLASNDGESVPSAHLKATFSNLDDQENGCSSTSERAVDPDDCDTNAPNSGELSHILSLQAQYYPGITEDECATWPANPPGYNAFFASGQGNLFAIASGTGHTYTLNETGTSTPLTLDPGEGICIGFNANWPHDPSNQVSAPYDDDNVAQGDSLSFDVRFTLEQV